MPRVSAAGGPRFVVLDDDPTGVQTLAGVRVLLAWDAARIRHALAERRGVHLITNTRALPAERVQPLIEDAARTAREAVADVHLVLRGDSTLRGHLREEYLGVRDATFAPVWPVLLLAPALPSAGRITLGGVHLFQRDGVRVPLHDTEYSRDGVFAYRSARLLQWAEERSSGLFRASAGIELDLEALRSEGAAAVARALAELAASAEPVVLAPDAETVADLELVAEGYVRACENGVGALVRCAPTLAGVLAGTTATAEVSFPAGGRGVLLVCGSYVPLATRQLARLVASLGHEPIEADVELLAGAAPDAEIERLASETSSSPRPGGCRRAGNAACPPPMDGVARGRRAHRVEPRPGGRRTGCPAAGARGEGRHHLRHHAARRRGRRRGRRRRPCCRGSIALEGVVARRAAPRLPRRARQRRRRRSARTARRRGHGRIEAVVTAFRDVLEERRAAGAAVGAFTCYDVTTALGVARAAERRGLPAILLVAEASMRSPEGRLLVPALLAVAQEAAVPMCVQLDHVADEALIDAALAAGVGAVMADGSRLPLPDNSAFAAAVRERARGAGIEAELGHIEGGEDVAEATEAGALTDPDEAARFVESTGCDCLAVSIGNVHGRYASPPRLDWPRLEQIRERVDVPLSLHGASGLSGEDVRRAVALGVSKVNLNAELREAYLTRLRERLPSALEGLRLLELTAALVDAVADVVAAKLELLGPAR